MSTPAPKLVADRYSLLERIGRGGVGEVWSACDRVTGAEVAIKLLQSFHVDNPEVHERFLREGRLLARIQSEHVCRVLGTGTHEGTPFLVVERIVGEPLDVAVKGARALPFGEVARVIDDVLAGLAAVHAVSVVHRDLKPSNVILVGGEPPDTSGMRRARLIDFGISKLLAPGERPLTATVATLGSPSYMAPEQLGGFARADERCDIYAAGTMAYRLLSGVVPFPPENHQHLLILKQSHAAPSLMQRTGASWPASLEEFLAKMLVRDPAGRPQSASEAREAWRRVCAQLSGFTTNATTAAIEEDEADTPILSRS